MSNKATVSKLCALASSSTARGVTGPAEHTRRAFELAYRARRLLEASAETAARDRWDSLEAPGQQPRDPIARYAAECVRSAIKYPVHGEAKVYAALLDAVDLAHVVSEVLYQAWLGTQPRVAPLPVPDTPVNRLGGPMAPGCIRSFDAYSDEDSVSDE